MSRIDEVKPGLFARFVFWIAKRKTKKLTGKAYIPGPLKIMAHHTPVMMAYGSFEGMFERAKLVDEALKSLASIRAATLIGCPF